MKKMSPIEWILTGILAIILIISATFLVVEMTKDTNNGFHCSESIEITHNHPFI